MCRHLLFIAFLLSGQFAVGQNSIYGNYSDTGMFFDSLGLTNHLSLRQDGSYTLKHMMRDSSITVTGKWWKNGNDIKLKPKYSKAEKKYGPEKTFLLNIEGEKLIWKPYKSKRELERETKKFEKEMSETVGEKVTLINKSGPLIFYKEN